MNIYTKTGDSGETSLLGNKRVKKDCQEMMAIGEVDELNATLGVLIAMLPENFFVAHERLLTVQHRLFNLGANLAAVQTALNNVPEITEQYVTDLEVWIDEMSAKLPPLAQFVLPVGYAAAAQSFFARAVCRRAERAIVSLGRSYNLDPVFLKYMNRLSDMLFVLARWINFRSDKSEIIWQK